MIDFLTRYKSTVDQELLVFLRQKKQELSKVNPWGVEVTGWLTSFVSRGKTIRGSLAIFSYRMFRNDMPKELCQTAAALELFHSAFLIHDDIADRDTKRRGMDSLYYRYQKLMNNNHKGVSLAIHAGDLAFFLGSQLASDKVKIIVASELANVCVAQMDDIAGSKHTAKLYRYKTARYTFSLPLVVGATLAHVRKTTIRDLELLGETLGLLYQIRDDELDSEQTLSKKPFYAQAKKQIASLSVTEKHKKSLLELAHFCMVRKK